MTQLHCLLDLQSVLCFDRIPQAENGIFNTFWTTVEFNLAQWFTDSRVPFSITEAYHTPYLQIPDRLSRAIRQYPLAAKITIERHSEFLLFLEHASAMCHLPKSCRY